MKPILRDPETGRILDKVEVLDADSGQSLGNVVADQALEASDAGASPWTRTCMNLRCFQVTVSRGKKIRRPASTCPPENPDSGGFCIFAGLERVIEHVNNPGIYPDDIEYLQSLGIFSEKALDRVAREVRFTGDIWAVPEGTVVFPDEPLIRVTGPIAEAQVLETTLLAIVGHQTLIATKAARLCHATKGAPVVEFGARRAHGPEAALYGARSAYIGGCAGTSNVRAGKKFGIPVRGTHAHSWVESFDSEIESFRGFVGSFPDNTILLVDTYDTINGIEQAIQVAGELPRSRKTSDGHTHRQRRFGLLLQGRQGNA